MRLASSEKIPSGPNPTGTVAGVWSHPVVLVALQVAPLKTDTMPGPSFSPLLTYTVSVRPSIAIPLGRFPTLIVGHGPLQPETSSALQRRVSITETVSPPALGPFVLKPLAT